MNPTEIDGRINMLLHQRNQALDQNVMLAGQIAALTAENAELKKKLEPPEAPAATDQPA